MQIYEFTVEENLEPGAVVGSISAKDEDLGNNASLKYNLVPKDGSFSINPTTGMYKQYQKSIMILTLLKFN